MKRILVLVALLVFVGPMFAQSANDELVAALIKKLRSDSFKDREAAYRALQELPKAEPALRKALETSDRELSKRISELLEYYELEHVRDADTAIKEGRIDRLAEMLGRWPAGKHDSHAWRAVSDLAMTLKALHEKQGGKKLNLFAEKYRFRDPECLSAERITEATRGNFDRMYFLRAQTIDFIHGRGKSPKPVNWFSDSAPFAVASGPITMHACWPSVFIAGGNIELRGDAILNAIIVSGGDVDLQGSCGPCLIIARGKVTCSGELGASRVVAGRSITINTRREPDECILTENEPNPLGFIRWSDEPKKKDAGNAK